MSLRDFWYIACESRQLKRRPRKARLFGEAVVLWRDGQGRAHAMPDRCSHRNAPLSHGAVVEGCLVCPYHGWRFDGEGRCVFIPSLAGERPVPRSAHMKAWPVCEQDGYVWVCPGQGTPPERPRPFPHLGEKGWTSFRMRTRFASSVEACLENFLDCPHTATVHKGWFRNPDAREMDAVVRRGAESVEVEFQNEPVTDSLIARLFYPKGAVLRHTDRFLMPNVSRVDYCFGPRHHFIITSQATPVSEAETEVHTVITFCYGNLGWLVRLLFEPMSRRIIRQDVDILALHGPNVRRFGGESYAHVETDLVSLHMQALRRRAERGEPPPAGEAETTVRIRF